MCYEQIKFRGFHVNFLSKLGKKWQHWEHGPVWQALAGAGHRLLTRCGSAPVFSLSQSVCPWSLSICLHSPSPGCLVEIGIPSFYLSFSMKFHSPHHPVPGHTGSQPRGAAVCVSFPLLPIQFSKLLLELYSDTTF